MDLFFFLSRKFNQILVSRVTQPWRNEKQKDLLRLNWRPNRKIKGKGDA